MSNGRVCTRDSGLTTRCHAGFSLIEMVLALSIIAIGFIGIIGLLGAGLANDQTSTEETEATNIADSIFADIKSSPGSATASVRYNLPLPFPPASSSQIPLSGAAFHTVYFDDGGNFISPIDSGSAPANAVYAARVTGVQTLSVGATPAQTNSMVRVLVMWPAAAAVSSGSLQIVAAFRNH